jgi:hypothetical protein
MAYSNTTLDAATNLGKMLLIMQQKGLVSQINTDVDSEFARVMALVEGKAVGRKQTWRRLDNSGIGRVATRKSGVRTFASADPLKASELEFQYKEMTSTIELEGMLYRTLLQSADLRDNDAWMEENAALIDANKTLLLLQAHGDGTGVVVTTGSAAIVSDQVVVTQKASSGATLARGCVAWAQDTDRLIPYAANGAAAIAVTVSSGTVSYFSVEGTPDVDAGTVTLAARDASGTALTITNVDNLIDGIPWYRACDVNAGVPDISGAISDYGLVSSWIPGFDSFCQADGRTVNGAVHSGRGAAMVVNGAGAVIDIDLVQSLVRKLIRRNGFTKFMYDEAFVDPSVIDAMISNQEDDVRLQAGQARKLGAGSVSFMAHGNEVILRPSLFARKDSFRLMPSGEVAPGRKLLQLHLSEFEAVGDGKFQQKPASGGDYEDTMVQHMVARVGFVCLRPSAIGDLRNFVLS